MTHLTTGFAGCKTWPGRNLGTANAPRWITPPIVVLKSPWVTSPSPDERYRMKIASNAIANGIAAAEAVDEDSAIETAYRLIREAIESGRFDSINEMLGSLSPSSHLNSVLLSVLSATNIPDILERLPSRKFLFRAVKARLSKTEGAEAAEDLLYGLE